MQDKSVIAVVVTYNRKKLLLECIHALLNQTYPDLRIFIIDNASTDGTESIVRNNIEEPNVEYYNTGSNLGGAGGFQFGIRKAVDAGCDYVWVMDDDSIPEHDALMQLMLNGSKLKTWGFLASRVLWTDHKLCRMNIPKDERLHPLRGELAGNIRVGSATFVSVIFPVSVIKEVGLPIKEFFIWSDDLEYTRRITLKYPAYLVGDSIVIHKCGTNNGANIATDVEERIDRYKYAYRNEVYVYRREGVNGYLHLFARTPLHILRVIKNSSNHKKRRISVIFKSTMEGFSFHPQIEYCNKKNKQ